MEYKDKGVLFLGAFAMSQEKHIKQFAKRFHLTYPIGLENGIAASLGAKGIPETFFINKNGVITTRYSKKIKYREIKSAIEKIL